MKTLRRHLLLVAALVLAALPIRGDSLGALDHNGFGVLAHVNTNSNGQAPAKFTAVANTGTITGTTVGSSAADQGVTWLPTVLPSSLNWAAVNYNGTKFLALARGFPVNVTGTTVAGLSADGNNWSATTMPGQPSDSHAVDWTASVWNGSIWVAVTSGGLGTLMASSPDAITWTQHLVAASGGEGYSGVDWNGALFCAVANTGGTSNHTALSADGATWTVGVIQGANWRAIAHIGSTFCAVSSSGTTMSTSSTDCTTWTPHTATDQLAAIVSTGSSYCAVSSAAATSFTSTDCSTWTTHTMPAAGWTGVTYNGTTYVAVRNGATAATSTDCATWTTVNMSATANWSAVSGRP